LFARTALNSASATSEYVERISLNTFAAVSLVCLFVSSVSFKICEKFFASLLNHYTKKGQYIIVTHNDAIILDSKILYGVSMHDGVSKILSLQLD